MLLAHPWSVRARVVDHLHACLDAAPERVRTDARAAKLRATRSLGRELRGGELVERVAEACAALAEEARAGAGGEAPAILADFVAEWAQPQPPAHAAGDDKKRGGVGALVDANLVSVVLFRATAIPVPSFSCIGYG